jgi:hypothetical protein
LVGEVGGVGTKLSDVDVPDITVFEARFDTGDGEIVAGNGDGLRVGAGASDFERDVCALFAADFGYGGVSDMPDVSSSLMRPMDRRFWPGLSRAYR